MPAPPASAPSHSPSTSTARLAPVRARRPRTWLLGAAALVLVAGAGTFAAVRLIGLDGDSAPLGAAAGVRGDTDDPAGRSGPTADLGGEVRTVRVPGTAPDSTDATTGARVTFGAQNLTDGDRTTAWRVAGDASGTALTIDFAGPVELREVGLINGYAKRYPGYDGYRSNRRILAVRWTFDDGSSAVQRLGYSRTVQALDLDAIETEQVLLEILRTAAPERGSRGRDFTAISDLRLGGVAG
ncbi:hypothetical protein E8D34_03055 [Nocardioides sp. GY 10113]|uniref:NADase-type glycan-binding domain-containing protein n=1 Tax=Nocardioides sp. GY 10113 TaxID=2569761 RepID=UPI0010A83948|nr:hypothetical protein [Nocardioides sp. GY 10113]TIC88668.1 hypothetical protein E8D34_03055 [Nocardioides sp. GY 10113]